MKKIMILTVLGWALLLALASPATACVGALGAISSAPVYAMPAPAFAPATCAACQLQAAPAPVFAQQASFTYAAPAPAMSLPVLDPGVVAPPVVTPSCNYSVANVSRGLVFARQRTFAPAFASGVNVNVNYGFRQRAFAPVFRTHGYATPNVNVNVGGFARAPGGIVVRQGGVFPTIGRFLFGRRVLVN